MQAAAESHLHAIDRANVDRVEHEVPEESIGARGHSGGHGGLIAGNAGDQDGPRNAVDIHHRGPRLRQFRRVLGRQVPAQSRGNLPGGLARLCAECFEESPRKEMNVRVQDGEITPGSLHSVCSSV